MGLAWTGTLLRLDSSLRLHSVWLIVGVFLYSVEELACVIYTALHYG
jgi:hypothetical protein